MESVNSKKKEQERKACGNMLMEIRKEIEVEKEGNESEENRRQNKLYGKKRKVK
jgi:hypothetical protein